MPFCKKTKAANLFNKKKMKRCSDYRAQVSPQEQNARCKEPCNLTTATTKKAKHETTAAS